MLTPPIIHQPSPIAAPSVEVLHDISLLDNEITRAVDKKATSNGNDGKKNEETRLRGGEGDCLMCIFTCIMGIIGGGCCGRG